MQNGFIKKRAWIVQSLSEEIAVSERTVLQALWKAD
jgi:hypothetical protein